MRTSTRRRPLVAVTVVVAAAIFAACGGDDDTDTGSPADGESSTDPGDTESSGDDEFASVKMTTIGFPNEVKWVWADERGVFEEHGIEVEPVQTGGGAAGVAAVMSGSADIGFVGGTDAIKAYSEGFPITIVGAAYFNVNPPQPNGRGVLVGADSGIDDACGLVDRKVGVDQLGGISHIYTAAWVRDAGCDPNDVRWIALPSGQLPTALEEGRVDAAGLNAARAQALVATGSFALLTDPMGAVAGDVAYAVYVATTEFVEDNADLVERWVSAMDEAYEQVTDPANEDEVYALMAEIGQTEPDAIAALANEPQVTRVPADVLQSMVDVMIQEGYLSDEIDTSGLLSDIALPE